MSLSGATSRSTTLSSMPAAPTATLARSAPDSTPPAPPIEASGSAPAAKWFSFGYPHLIPRVPRRTTAKSRGRGRLAVRSADLARPTNHPAPRKPGVVALLLLDAHGEAVAPVTIGDHDHRSLKAAQPDHASAAPDA